MFFEHSQHRPHRLIDGSKGLAMLLRTPAMGAPGSASLLVVHLPEGSRAGSTHGWGSKEHRQALRSVDQAMGAVLAMFKEHGLLARTTVFVTSLNGTGGAQSSTATAPAVSVSSTVPWIASGAGIRPGHIIRQPVSILDTGATVMRTFGLTTHTEWDGRPIEEIFRHQPAIPAGLRKER